MKTHLPCVVHSPPLCGLGKFRVERAAASSEELSLLSSPSERRESSREITGQNDGVQVKRRRLAGMAFRPPRGTTLIMQGLEKAVKNPT